MGYIIEPADAAWLVEFVNEYATEAWMARGSESGYRAPSELGESPLMAHSVPTRSLVVLADALFHIISTDSAELRSAALNDLMEPAAPEVRVVPLDRLTSVVLSMTEDRAALLALSCGLALADLIDRLGEDRIGTCDADRCDRAYVDRSPRGSRAYCSQRCQTRMRVARHRARHRSDAHHEAA